MPVPYGSGIMHKENQFEEMSDNFDKFSKLRQDYDQGSLSKKSVLPNPFDQFEKWYEEASRSTIKEPNAMVLSTSGGNGRASSRMVLLKGFDEKGFLFYSNYRSRKGQEMAVNPYVSALFFWDVLEQQIRIEGTVERLSAEESDAYFKLRPRKSQIGAVASAQSEVLASREQLEEKFDQIAADYPEEQQEIPRPEHWGGYRISPYYFEFWQGRRSRLHDRICFNQRPDGIWSVARLSP